MTVPRSPRFDAAIAAIDAANADDPNTIVVAGIERPKELAHAELVTEWVLRLDPDASEAQLLAARAHHLRRWSVPRSDYPDGRKGYLQWRTALKRQHAAEVGEILSSVGFDEGTIERVQAIVQKQGLGSDPEVQTHEDALCLVFLATQFDELADRLGDEHTVEVLAKTLTKMSASGKEAATTLDLTDAERRLLGEALARG